MKTHANAAGVRGDILLKHDEARIWGKGRWMGADAFCGRERRPHYKPILSNSFDEITCAKCKEMVLHRLEVRGFVYDDEVVEGIASPVALCNICGKYHFDNGRKPSLSNKDKYTRICCVCGGIMENTDARDRLGRYHPLVCEDKCCEGMIDFIFEYMDGLKGYYSDLINTFNWKCRKTLEVIMATILLQNKIKFMEIHDGRDYDKESTYYRRFERSSFPIFG